MARRLYLACLARSINCVVSWVSMGRLHISGKGQARYITGNEQDMEGAPSQKNTSVEEMKVERVGRSRESEIRNQEKNSMLAESLQRGHQDAMEIEFVR